MLASACVAPVPAMRPTGAQNSLHPAFATSQLRKNATKVLPAHPALIPVRALGADSADCDGATAAAKATAGRTGHIFEALGGTEGVRKAVDVFYQKVLSDPEVSHFFAGLDMAKQKSKQMAFMAFVFGGPDAYRGRDMRTAHQNLPGLSHSHFDAIKGHFARTLEELGVAQETIEEAAAVVESTRGQMCLLDA